MRSRLKLLLLLSVLGLIACERGEDSKSRETSNRRKTASGPPFKKEGELYLIKATGDTIRKIDIEIAEQEYERNRGLMYRRNMKDTQGMLFIFEDESQRSFWMKNTLMGLDILYIKADGEIESIAKYVIPKSERSIPSKGPAKYVLEVIEGFCDLYQVEVGDKIVWSGEDQPE